MPSSEARLDHGGEHFEDRVEPRRRGCLIVQGPNLHLAIQTRPCFLHFIGESLGVWDRLLELVEMAKTWIVVLVLVFVDTDGQDVQLPLSGRARIFDFGLGRERRLQPLSFTQPA